MPSALLGRGEKVQSGEGLTPPPFRRPGRCSEEAAETRLGGGPSSQGPRAPETAHPTPTCPGKGGRPPVHATWLWFSCREIWDMFWPDEEEDGMSFTPGT